MGGSTRENQSSSWTVLAFAVIMLVGMALLASVESLIVYSALVVFLIEMMTARGSSTVLVFLGLFTANILSRFFVRR